MSQLYAYSNFISFYISFSFIFFSIFILYFNIFTFYILYMYIQSTLSLWITIIFIF